MPIFVQDVIHKLEQGTGTRVLKTIVGIIAVVALALLYDMAAYRNFWTAEAMDTAQLARNISEGEGYSTDYIRPFAVHLLRKHVSRHDAATNSIASVIEKSPDLSNPPAYPALLAGLFKVMPSTAPDVRAQRMFSTFGPELWITAFNQVLLLLCTVLVYLLARRLFDEPVAWVSAAVFAGTELFWRYSLSGLPTLWLTALLLLLSLLLVKLDVRVRDPASPQRGSMAWAALLGLITAAAGLTKYSLLVLIVPLIIYLATLPSPQRVALALVAATAFLAAVVPWVARNYSAGGAMFGTAGYAALQGTVQFPGDALWRSLSPDFSTMTTSAVAHKIVVNMRETLLNELPRLGGSWVTALFLAGLLVPFRSAVTSRMRVFLVSVLAILVCSQAALSAGPATGLVNASDSLTIGAPLAFVYGVSLLFNLLEQFAGVAARYTVLGIFFILACAPLVLTFAAPPSSPLAYPPYYPPWIQEKAVYVEPDDWMMSDIPAAVAWYGDRKAVSLSLKHGTASSPSGNDFYSLNRLKPLRGVHLSAQTLKTLDGGAIARWRQSDTADADWDRFEARIKALAGVVAPEGENPGALDPLMEVYSLAEKHWVRGRAEDWEGFVLGIFVAREVPSGFPLKTAPEGLTPEIFLTDSERPAQKTIKPSEHVPEP